MKTWAIVDATSGNITDMEAGPGTTAREVLNQMGLSNEFVLSSGSGKEPFAASDNIYTAVEDGAKLYVSTPVEVA